MSHAGIGLGTRPVKMASQGVGGIGGRESRRRGEVGGSRAQVPRCPGPRVLRVRCLQMTGGAEGESRQGPGGGGHGAQHFGESGH